MRQAFLRAAAAITAGTLVGLFGLGAYLAAGKLDPPRQIEHSTAIAALPSTPAAATPTPAPPLLAAGRPVTADPHVVGWTLTDVTDDQVLASNCPDCTTHSASTIKAWLAGDALRRAGPTPSRRLWRLVDAAILDSDDAAATALFWDGGGRPGLQRMVDTCHLTHTTPNDAWGFTTITAGDLAQLAVCIAHGDVAGPWTSALVDRMRHVRGPGRFGPVAALPGADVAMKNGWIPVAGQWEVNCLALIDGAWAIGVITRYPANLGMSYGGQLCAQVTHQLAAPDAAATPAPAGPTVPDSPREGTTE
jgi:hypothetical protein